MCYNPCERWLSTIVLRYGYSTISYAHTIKVIPAASFVGGDSLDVNDGSQDLHFFHKRMTAVRHDDHPTSTSFTAQTAIIIGRQGAIYQPFPSFLWNDGNSQLLQRPALFTFDTITMVMARYEIRRILTQFFTFMTML